MKKKFYQIWWFWLITAIVVFWLIVIGGFIFLVTIGILTDPTLSSNGQVSPNTTISSGNENNIQNSTSTKNVEPKATEPKATDKRPDPLQIKWNIADLDCYSNGNLQRASEFLNSISKEEYLSLKYIEVDAKNIMKSPWEYYGRLVKLTGTAMLVESYPPGSENSNKFAKGKVVTEIVLLDDEFTTYCDIIIIGSSPVNENESIEIYGFPVGKAEVDNPMGGKSTNLMFVGKQF